MTDFVKHFIQNNIDFINSENWYAVCREFYEASRREFNNTEDYFYEFVECLATVGIHFLSESKEERKAYIELVLKDFFDKFIASNRIKDNRQNYIMSLLCLFDFSIEELYDICDNLAEQCGLEVVIDTTVPYYKKKA